MRAKKSIRLGLLVAFVCLAVLGLQACAPASVSTSPNPGNEMPSSDERVGE